MLQVFRIIGFSCIPRSCGVNIQDSGTVLTALRLTSAHAPIELILHTWSRPGKQARPGLGVTTGMPSEVDDLMGRYPLSAQRPPSVEFTPVPGYVSPNAPSMTRRPPGY